MLRRKLFQFVLAQCAMITAVGAAAAQGYTTRIEPRPFYGAVVTLEEGVRVIRPLPPERHVIINPGNAPVSLGFNDTRVYENRVIRQYDESSRGGQPYVVDGLRYGGFGAALRRRGHGKDGSFRKFGYTGLNYGYGPAAGLGARPARRFGAPVR